MNKLNSEDTKHQTLQVTVTDKIYTQPAITSQHLHEIGLTTKVSRGTVRSRKSSFRSRDDQS